MNFVNMAMPQSIYDGYPFYFGPRPDNLQVPQFDANGVLIGVVNSGQSALDYIASLASTYGWPLRGIFMSGQSQQPHLAMHVSEFPISVEADPAEGVQDQMEAVLERWFKYENPTTLTFRRQSNEVMVDAGYDLPGIDDKVAFELRSGGGAMPSGLAADTLYWVVAVNGGTRRFQVSTTQGGAVEKFTSDGTPPVYMVFEDQFGVDLRSHWVGFHVFNYRGGTGNNYAPKTDYTMRVNNRGPNAGQWWVS